MKDELMELKIARALCNCTKNNQKTLDIKFIDEILDIAINSKELNDYVKSYEVNISEVNDNVAEYDGENKKIVIYEKSMCERIIHDLINTTICYDVNDFEKRLFINSFLAQVLLHEVEHANQKRIIENENGLESSILKLCELEIRPKSEFIFEKSETGKLLEKLRLAARLFNYRVIYKELYDYAPHERLAQIKSYQEIIDSLCFIDRHSIVTRKKEIEKLGTVLNGYDDTSSPTITYLSNQGREKELKQFDWYSDDKEEAIKLSKEKYNLKDRMKYGLPIDEKEHQLVKEIHQDMSL